MSVRATVLTAISAVVAGPVLAGTVLVDGCRSTEQEACGACAVEIRSLIEDGVRDVGVVDLREMDYQPSRPVVPDTSNRVRFVFPDADLKIGQERKAFFAECLMNLSERQIEATSIWFRSNLSTGDTAPPAKDGSVPGVPEELRAAMAWPSVAFIGGPRDDDQPDY